MAVSRIDPYLVAATVLAILPAALATAVAVPLAVLDAWFQQHGIPGLSTSPASYSLPTSLLEVFFWVLPVIGLALVVKRPRATAGIFLATSAGVLVLDWLVVFNRWFAVPFLCSAVAAWVRSRGLRIQAEGVASQLELICELLLA